jgi:hypothetical protein
MFEGYSNIYQTSLTVLWVISAINQSINQWMELSQIDLNIQNLNVFLKRVIATVFRITGQFHYIKFLTQRVPFKYNNLNLEQIYPQSLIHIHK